MTVEDFLASGDLGPVTLALQLLPVLYETFIRISIFLRFFLFLSYEPVRDRRTNKQADGQPDRQNA